MFILTWNHGLSCERSHTA